MLDFYEQLEAESVRDMLMVSQGRLTYADYSEREKKRFEKIQGFESDCLDGDIAAIVGSENRPEQSGDDSME